MAERTVLPDGVAELGSPGDAGVRERRLLDVIIYTVRDGVKKPVKTKLRKFEVGFSFTGWALLIDCLSESRGAFGINIYFWRNFGEDFY